MTDAYQDYDEDEYDPDDFCDDLHYEPDEGGCEYAWRAESDYEEHCEQAHGGNDCDCRAPLGERIRERFRSARRRVIAALRRDRYYDMPPF
jgi:hypothetical protein